MPKTRQEGAALRLLESKRKRPLSALVGLRLINDVSNYTIVSKPGEEKFPNYLLGNAITLKGNATGYIEL